MIGLALSLFLQNAPLVQARPADCIGVLVHFADGTSQVLTSFWVAGTKEQLANISAVATQMGASVQPPREVDGNLVLFVFFESSVDGFQAFKLTNDVFRGVYHPGVAKESIKKDAMFLPPSALKNCKK